MDTRESSQTLDNRSFNNDFQIHENLLYGQVDANTIAAVKVNASGELIANLDNDSEYNLLYATEYTATYNYIMRYTRGTTDWECQRETVASGLREYARGTTDLATNWANRATLTYGA